MYDAFDELKFMRNSRAVTVGLILIVLAGLIVWRFSRPDALVEPSSSTVVQSPGSAKAKDLAPPLAAPHETGREPTSQASAASPATVPSEATPRLDLHSIRACHDALLSKRVLETMGDCDRTPGGQAADIQVCRHQLARVAKQASDALAAAGSCPADLLNGSAYYEAIKELAVRGDIPAQRCFITGYFVSAVEQPEESPMRPDQLDEYRVLAKKFIDEGLERGDWSVVRWLAQTTTGLQDALLMRAYPFGGSHPETAYRMNYLLMLGNQNSFEESVNPRQFIEKRRPDNNLPPPTLKEAQDWARSMFDQHFNGSQEGASLEEMCEH